MCVHTYSTNMYLRTYLCYKHVLPFISYYVLTYRYVRTYSTYVGTYVQYIRRYVHTYVRMYVHIYIYVCTYVGIVYVRLLECVSVRWYSVELVHVYLILHDQCLTAQDQGCQGQWVQPTVERVL